MVRLKLTAPFVDQVLAYIQSVKRNVSSVKSLLVGVESQLTISTLIAAGVLKTMVAFTLYPSFVRGFIRSSLVTLKASSRFMNSRIRQLISRIIAYADTY